MPAVAASEFKAKCLDLMDRVGRHEMEPISITKHGRVVAMLVPAHDPAVSLAGLHGFMRHSVMGVDDIDLTAPAGDEEFTAANGQLHF